MTATEPALTVDAVVYDFGGVFMPSPFEAIRQVGAEKGIEFELALAIVFGSYDQDTDHPWHRCERGEVTLEEARAAIRQLGRDQGQDLDLFDMLKYISGGGGIRDDMVANVRRVREAGLKTAILTNNIVEGGPFWRPMVPLDELFDAVVDSSEVGMRKPDPRIYAHTLELLGGIVPERAVFLDDYEGNVRAAEAIGMIGVLVDLDPTEAIATVDRLITPT